MKKEAFDSHAVYVVPCSTPFPSCEKLVAELKTQAIHNGVHAQALNSSAVLSRRQVVYSFFQAFKAFEEGKASAKTLENEAACRLAFSRQFSDAVKIVGVKDPKDLVLVFYAPGFECAKRIATILASLGAKPKPPLGPTDSKERALSQKLKPPKNCSSGRGLEDFVIEKMALTFLD